MNILFLFLSVILLMSTVANSYAATYGSLEQKTPENFYFFGNGILEFQKNSLEQCILTIPNYSVKSSDPSQGDPLLNIDGFTNNFFVVLGNNIDNSFEYFQIGLPSGTGLPSYLLDMKNNDGIQVRGGYYVDYENLAVVIESDSERKILPDSSYKKYFDSESKDITESRYTFGPGNYTFGAILLKSNGNSMIKNEICSIRVDWPFTVASNGNVTTQSPAISVGKLFESTEKFSPLKQHKYGVESSAVDCKPGLRLILQQDESEKIPACVTPETKEKLVERGWTKSNN